MQEERTTNRKLAAIMFTDIVGYTALMGKDSAKALELVRQSMGIQKPLVEKHNGIWLKEMGDGAMAQFGSALDAVNCAVEIQRTSRADFEKDLRIGIHLGDITIENNDVYGDGVNVASRLESIADPGAIYISESVEKAIRGQSKVQAKFLGEIQLKNVDYGVRTYALQGIGLPVPDLGKEKGLSGRFFAEIERRGVARAGIIYILISILLILTLPLMQSWMSFPEWTEKALYILLVFGFPVAIFLAWRYERSPDGFVRSTSDKSWQNPLKISQRKPLTGNAIMVALGMVTLVLFLYTQNKSSANTNRSLKKTSYDPKSVAVLPFENMSSDPDQDYFSDGMTEDILNHLSKIADLSVKSRTSTLQYKGAKPNMRKIGAELGVGSIIEGSVRKSGNMVRIVAQLIDVNNDKHIWSETYDRELNDVFQIQSDISMAIATVLKAKLSNIEIENINKESSTDITAYDYYLKALRWNYLTMDDALIMIDQALILDPQFTGALSLKGDIWFEKRIDGYPAKIWMDSANYYWDKANMLDPTLPNPYIGRSRLKRNFLRKTKEAKEDLQTAYRYAPNNPDVLNALGSDYLRSGNKIGAEMIIKAIDLSYTRKDAEYFTAWGKIYEFIGEFENAENLYFQAGKIDPGSPVPLSALVSLYHFWGKYDLYAEYADMLYKKFPKYGTEDDLAWANFLLGNLDLAEEYWSKYPEIESRFSDTTQYVPFRHRLAYVKWMKGDKEEALRLFNEQLKINLETHQGLRGNSTWASGGYFYDYASVNAFLGNKEVALQWFDSAYHKGYFELYTINDDPLLTELKKEKRFQDLVNAKKENIQFQIDAYKEALANYERNEQLKVLLDK